MRKLMYAAVLLPVLIGCAAGGKSLDGKWNAADMKGLPPGSKATFEFSGGKDLNINLVMKQPKPDGKEMTMTIDVKCSYTQTGDAITFKANSADLKVDGLTADEKKIMDPMMDGIKKQMVDEMNKSNNGGKVKWVDDNTLEITGTDGTQKLTRA